MAQFTVRPASVDDAQALAELFAAVAEERDGIATEPPVDISQRAAQFARTIASSIVAAADGQIIGMIHVEISRHGFGEIGMRTRQYRRASGELWDSIVMGLAL